MAPDDTNPIPDLGSEDPTPAQPVRAANPGRPQGRRRVKTTFEQLAESVPELPSGFMAASSPAAQAPPPPTPQPPAGRRYARWRVLETVELPRSASTYTLEAGRVLSEQHYCIELLQRQGAKLEKIEE